MPLAPAGLQTLDAWDRHEGSHSLFGATWFDAEKAWNFAVFSRHATAMTLLLYGADVKVPLLEMRLDPIRSKSGRIWHLIVPEAAAPGAQYYAWRADGPHDPSAGHRFDPDKILLDPYATAVYFPPDFSRERARRPQSNAGSAPLGVLPRSSSPANESEPRPRHTHDAVVYELHVKGFTAHPSSEVSPNCRGTFLGLIEKIPYLKELGVTVVELLPVHQFDPQEGNYWGYMTLNFFAPHSGYAVEDPQAEFRQMVRAFHEADIEVWLDVVYNHTAEGDETGPTYSLRGLDNSSYYLVDSNGGYRNDSGCGNTTRCAHPAMRLLVLGSLRHWAQTMKVDGFRFDLASVFARNSRGEIDMEEPPMVHEIGALGAQLGVRLIAEAWDIGAYLLGRSFPGLAWSQWNGQARDDLRAFVKGDPGKLSAFMTRMYGSDDLFPDRPGDVYRPYQSVNFITAHDGFCLYDLVAYNHKHNEANGHGNTDGAGENLSWNCGWEGDDGAPQQVLALRRRQVKNFFALLMLANGTPMFCAGDEFLNTQFGNNNPYNQDNETTWLDWSRLEQNRDVFRFFQKMIAFRKAHRSIGRSRFWREDVQWFGARGDVDDSWESRSVAWLLRGGSFGECDLYVLVNAHWLPIAFQIGEGAPGEWSRIVDTSRPSPEDIFEESVAPPLTVSEYAVGPRSVVVLARLHGGETRS